MAPIQGDAAFADLKTGQYNETFASLDRRLRSVIQDLEEVAVLIRPRPDRWHFRISCYAAGRGRLHSGKVAVLREQHPVHHFFDSPGAFRVHPSHLQSRMLWSRDDRRLQVQVGIGNMDRQNPRRLSQFPDVNFKSLLRQQVHRNGVAAEGIHDQHIEILRFVALQFALHREARVAGNYFNPCAAVTQKREVFRIARNAHHIRINFIEANRVSRLSIRSESANSQAHDANARSAIFGRRARRASRYDQPSTAVSAVVGSWLTALHLLMELIAMQNASVHQRFRCPLRFIRVLLPDSKNAIEISRHGYRGLRLFKRRQAQNAGQDKQACPANYRRRLLPGLVGGGLFAVGQHKNDQEKHNPRGNVARGLDGLAGGEGDAFGQQRHDSEDHDRRADSALVQPRLLVANQDDEQQQRGHPETKLIFPESLEQMWREQGDKKSAGGAAGGYREIKGSQVARVGFRAGQLSVANHANDKERESIDGD